MQSRWNDQEAAGFSGDLAQRVYTSRLLGRDKSLVLHGGGNTSVKLRERNLFGDEEDILYVKGSGCDLEFIEAAGFSPVRLAHLRKLAQLKTLSDPHMVSELATHMTRASAPAPSVETILHAMLPYKYVDHGIFSFGSTAKESYERMIQLVDLAERYLKEHNAWHLRHATVGSGKSAQRIEIATLRQLISRSAGYPMVTTTRQDARTTSFVQRTDIAAVSQQGPVTPDHVIRTKRVPMLGRDFEAYADAYRKYFDAGASTAKHPKTILDPAPRVVLDARLGMCAVGRSVKDASIVADLYQHTMDVIERATLLGGYEALPARHIFDVEYWDLEQAKLRKASPLPVFAGEVALVTGAASGIGKACVEALLVRGAAVVGIDIDLKIESLHARADFLGIHCDVTSQDQIVSALETAVRAYGGLDILILNAGVFPSGAAIAALSDESWRKIMSVNLDAGLMLLRESHPLLKLAPRGGRVAIIGSKNVSAPGPGAAAYSASKAALTQIARVAALEWGADNIRVNTLHPNAVFDTGLWTGEMLASRAAHYGLSVEQYRKNNVLKTEITSRDVAELAAEVCGPLFAKTTGAQVPIDGGNERVI